MNSFADQISIRPARPADRPALERLAILDSAHLPSGDLLVSEVDGELVAALNPESGFAIADPFRPTADVVALLRMHARDRAARAPRGPPRPPRPGCWAGRRPGARGAARPGTEGEQKAGGLSRPPVAARSGAPSGGVVPYASHACISDHTPRRSWRMDSSPHPAGPPGGPRPCQAGVFAFDARPRTRTKRTQASPTDRR